MQIPENLSGLVLTLHGWRYDVRLRVPEVSEVVSLVMSSEIRSSQLVSASLVLELQSLVDSIDGEYIEESLARAIVASSGSLAQVLQVRNGSTTFL